MNKLPNDWKIKTIKEVCNIYTGNSINKQKKEKNFIGLKEGLNYIGTKDISFDNIINYDNGVKIPFKNLKDFKIAKSNSVLLCIEGGIAGRKIGFTNQDICFGNKLCCFKAIEDEPKFIYYYLQSDYFLEYFYSNIQGLIGGITKEKIKQIKIPLPPLAIQKQIAEKLDYLFDKIDKALKFLKENKEYIKKYRLSILKYAFEGKLTPSSKNWETKTLGEVCEINPKNKLDDNLEVSFIPMNLISDKFQNKFSYKIKNWKDVKKGYTHLQNNCIALAKITPCFENGKCVILRNLKNGYGAGTTELIILLPNSKKIIIEYIFYFMNTQHFIEQGKRNFKGSVGQLRIGTDFVSNFKIPIPNIETQKEIVSILDKKFKVMDEIERLNNENIENLLLLKKSLLKEAFSGKL